MMRSQAITTGALVAQAVPGSIIGMARIADNTAFATLDMIPIDGTVPQNTEGTQIISLSYTPRKASSLLLVSFSLNNVFNGAGSLRALVAAMFRDAGVNSIYSQFGTTLNANYITNVQGHFIAPANAAVATTFNMRLGNTTGAAQAITTNTTLFGATSWSQLEIQEIAQ